MVFSTEPSLKQYYQVNSTAEAMMLQPNMNVMPTHPVRPFLVMMLNTHRREDQ